MELKRTSSAGKAESSPSKNGAAHLNESQELGELLEALTSAGGGDFSVRLPVKKGKRRGVMVEIARKFNEVVERNEALATEITRVERTVTREGLMTERASIKGATGGWSSIIDSINLLIGGLAQPTTEVVRVISAVAQGDLSQKMALQIDGQPVKGEFLRIGMTVNAMIDQLSSFADEVTRVAKEVGTEGKLGGQADVKGVSGVWKDLTDNVNQLAGNLTAQVRAISDQSEFLANMSHELRTPLNSLLVLAKVLSDNKDANLTPKQLEYASTIYSSGGDLLKLINEVLDLSKVEAGKMQLEIGEIMVSDLTESLRRNFETLAEEKGLVFSTEIATGIPKTLKTDPQRLEQILKNLLANAFKFTEQGSVKLRVESANPDTRFENDLLHNAEEVIAFSVIDSGIGIPKNKQKLIFEAFQQADGSTSRKYGGTGLGLSISREIARVLGGEIQVESTPQSGSTFTLYSPVRYQLADAAARATRLRASETLSPARLAGPVAQPQIGRLQDFVENPEMPESMTGKKVLIVDDDLRNIFAIKTLLEGHRMQVLHADNGLDGIEIIERNPDIDVVLMDIMMPELDGYETIKIIRKDPKKRWLPVIAVTAKALKEDRERCLEAGASDYLAKPVDENQLIELLRVWTGQQQVSLNA